VDVIHRRQSLRASKVLEEKASGDSKINFILDTVVEEIKGKDKVESVKIKNVKTDSVSELSCHAVFIFVGIEPNTYFVRNQLHMDEAGFIITEQDLMTSWQGIFACGDCRKKSLYQVITACAEGAVACDSAHKYLLNR
jgi:thioredoxin reductase (NADPH)